MKEYYQSRLEAIYRMNSKDPCYEYGREIKRLKRIIYLLNQ